LYIHAEYEEFGEYMTEGVALLYARVSTQRQVDEGMSLGVQERSMTMAAELAGYTTTELIREEGRSGKSISGRPALQEALRKLESGAASAMFVTRIDRLARSTQDFLSIVDHSQKHNWRLVMLDLNLDTSTSAGRFVVTIMSALAEMERGIIASRQKDIHKDRRDRGLVWGVDLGPKSKIPVEVMERIKEMRVKGMSYHAIAQALNADNVPTALGGEQWHGSTVRKALL
jgi:DNA invertase Pin-like site-specific DNA recombinase